MIVSIPRDEWIQAIDLTSFIGNDHSLAAGYVRVFVHEGQRRWLASDGTKGLHFAGAADHENWTLNIPIMAFAALKHNLVGGKLNSINYHQSY